MSSSKREYDVVVLGATGFTGERVLRYACKAFPSWRIAAAGRRESKLKAVVSGLPEGGTRVSVLAGVDVNIFNTVARMVRNARIVLNCVGPYRHYGEPVVRACVEAGTDYLDVCGEPEFMERVQLRYDAAAAERGMFAVSALGFDCVPAEVGAALCADALAARSGGNASSSNSAPETTDAPHHVESRLTVNWGRAGFCGHFATYESAVHGFGSAAALADVRKEARRRGLNAPPQIAGPKPRKPKAIEWRALWRAWALPFPGADAAVVRRTMSARATAGHPVLHYLAFFTIASRLRLCLFVALGGILTALAAAALGRRLLLRAPRLFTCGTFSHDGPTQEQMDSTTFLMTHEGFALDPSTGKPARKPAVRVSVAGPEPGYVATPVFLCEAAAELLANRDAIMQATGRQGGVLTPGQLLLMHETGYVDRLKSAGIGITQAQLA